MMKPIDKLATALPEVGAASLTRVSRGKSGGPGNSDEDKGNRQQTPAFFQTVQPVQGVMTSNIKSREGHAGGAFYQGEAVNKGLCADRQVSMTRTIHSDSDLPPGHMYQPYFWISPQARAYCEDSVVEQGAFERPVDKRLTSWIIDQLTMSEKAARENFAKRLEYRFVDYGFTSSDKSRNYGVFAKSAIKEGEYLGVFSGVGYLVQSGSFEVDIEAVAKDPKILHSMFNMPDFMSYCRTVQAGLHGKGQEQRTLMKYVLDIRSTKPGKKIVKLLPDNERYTPMHFLNSANKARDVNVDLFHVPLKTASGQYMVPVIRAIKPVSVGQELLLDYMLNKDYAVLAQDTAEKERKANDVSLANRIKALEMICHQVGGNPVSKFVHAPVIYVTEELRSRYGADKPEKS